MTTIEGLGLGVRVYSFGSLSRVQGPEFRV